MDIAKAQSTLLKSVLNTKIYDLVKETPLSYAPGISQITNNKVHLKREDQQAVFSFKIRGAYHKISRLSPAKRANGIVAASAGNHAQGVAMAAKKMNCQATIVMPKRVQQIKMAAVRALGAEVVLHGDEFDSANLYAQELAKSQNRTFIPPYEDADVIAGNATIAAEILRQHPEDIHAIFCAVGGGGLVSGVAAYVKALNPRIKVIGVESEESASMQASLRAGRPIDLGYVGSFADAVAVRRPGRMTFKYVQTLVDDMLTISNDELCAAIKDLYEDTRVIFEPAGALGVAGLKKYARQKRMHGKNVIALACGANMNFDRLRFVAERAEIGEQREALFAVTVPERPGSFRQFCKLLNHHNITEFNYRFEDPKKAQLFVGVEIQGLPERKALLSTLRSAGFPTIDLTENEIAKMHIRYMVGGRADAEHEALYQFEFPEQPGALAQFLERLNRLSPNKNISLFHYRNNGGDTGRLLAGIQIPMDQRRAFTKMLKRFEYAHTDESKNAVYKIFLQSGKHRP